MTTGDPEKLFTQVSQFIDDCNALIKDGQFVQLSGLEDKVSRLCAQVLDLSGEQRTQYADRLQQVVVSLQQLQDNLTAARDALSKQLGELPAHRKANVAYQKMESLDKEKKSE